MKYSVDSPIVGAPQRKWVTQEHVVNRIMQRIPTPLYTRHDFEKSIVPAYFQVCELTLVDPLIAIAQCMHETGNFTSWWSQRPRRNPAGIGVTGHTSAARPADVTTWAYDTEARLWRAGLSFASWSSAVEVHVGRLVAYALKGSAHTSAQRYYSELALAYRPLPEKYHGCAPTLRGLGGTWAYPGFTYAGRLAAYADWLAEG
jgi:hypothetical protein